MNNKYWYNINGVQVPDESNMISKLLDEFILFPNSRKYLDADNKTTCKETLVLFVNCNDIFAWASADAEEITMEELIQLFSYYEESPTNAAIFWVCKKRNLQAQKPILDRFVQDAPQDWINIMKGLPKNNN